MEEFRSFAFKSVSDELQSPAEEEECERWLPQEVIRDRTQEQRQRHDDDGNPDGVARAVQRMLVTACVLRDPLLAGASAEHAG